jgi:virginiamycin B lyase
MASTEPRAPLPERWTVGVRSLVALLAVFATAGAAVAAWSDASSPASGLPEPGIPGTATLTGTVTAPLPFTAARVYIRNLDRRMLYMVYTSQGAYRAVALFPGRYEVTVQANGLESSVHNLVLSAGDAPRLDLAMAPANPTIRRIVGWRAEHVDATDPAVRRTALTYDEIYPPGAGRDILERTCMLCHGESFISGNPGTLQSWVVRLDRMQGAALDERPAASYAEGLMTHRNQAMRFGLQDRKVLLDYLAANFGPDAEPRFVKVDQEIPLDEAKLGRAMYIEYYLPPDPPGELGNAPEYGSRRRGQDPRFDAEGNVWLVDRAFPHRLVRLDPRTGDQKDYILPDPLNGHHEVLVDPAGMIWLPEHSGRQPTTEKRLLGFNPKTESFEYLVPMDPDDVVRNETKWLQSLAMDSKMNIYVGWIMGGALSKYDRATGEVSVFPFPNVNAIPYGVVADSRDNIFIADWGSGGIVKFDSNNDQFTNFTPPSYPGHVRRLNVDTDDNVWWGVYSGGKRPGFLAKLDQRTGRITEYPVPRRNSQIYDVMQGPDGTLWSPDFGGSFAAILNFDPRTERFTAYPTPQNADMPKVQVTREGAIWYSPRSSTEWPGLGVLYPDMDEITTLGAYYVNGPPGYPFPHRRR